MTRRLRPKTRIRLALKAVNEEIRLLSQGGRYASGMASEGYARGYADALMDMELLLNGVIPNRRNYWEADLEPRP